MRWVQSVSRAPKNIFLALPVALNLHSMSSLSFMLYFTHLPGKCKNTPVLQYIFSVPMQFVTSHCAVMMILWLVRKINLPPNSKEPNPWIEFHWVILTEPLIAYAGLIKQIVNNTQTLVLVMTLMDVVAGKSADFSLWKRCFFVFVCFSGVVLPLSVL